MHSFISSVFLLFLLASETVTPAFGQTNFFAYFNWVTSSASLRQSQSSAAGAVLNNKIYLFGGEYNQAPLNTVEKFDPLELSSATINFQILSVTVPSPGATGHTAITVGSAVYLLGGSLTAVWKYDETNGFTSTGHTWPSTYYWSGATWNGVIYLVGGKLTSTGLATNSIITYTPGVGFATTTMTLTTGRYYHGTAILGNKLYVVGGLYTTTFASTTVTTCLATMEVIDLFTQTVTQVDLSTKGMTARCDPAVALLPNGLIAVLGGAQTITTSFTPVPQSTVQLIKLGSTTADIAVQTTNSLPTARRFAVALVLYGRLHVFSGYGTNNAQLTSMDVTDEQTAIGFCETAIPAYTWTGTSSPPVYTAGYIDLPTRTQGWKFMATIVYQGTATGATNPQSAILSKSNCAVSEGGFNFVITGTSWQIGINGGYQTFTGLPAVVIGTTYTITLLALPASSSWQLTVNGVTSTLVGVGNGAMEIPFHNLRIGGIGYCNLGNNPNGETLTVNGAFVGSISNLMLGSCDTIPLVSQYPGFGASNINSTQLQLNFVILDTVGNVVGQSVGGTPRTFAVQKMDGTTIVSWTALELTKSLLPNNQAKFTTPPVTLARNTKYQVSVTNGFVSNSTGALIPPLPRYWIFCTEDMATETSVQMMVTISMDVFLFYIGVFFQLISSLTYSVPIDNMQVTEFRSGSAVITWLFRNMAPGTASVAVWLVWDALEKGTLQSSFYTNKFGTIVPVTLFNFNATYQKEFTNIWVTNTPDSADSPTTVTMTVLTNNLAQHGLPQNGLINITFPIEWQYGFPTNPTSNIHIMLDTTDGTGTPTACTVLRVINSTITASTNWPSVIGQGQEFTLTITGISMPHSCRTLNDWVWAIKTMWSNGTLVDYLVRNTPKDSCQGKTVILFGDPHFQSFSGGSYDVNGRVNFFYNIITDRKFYWNSKFVSRNPRGHGTMHTYMGESAFLINDTHVFCDPVNWAMYVEGKRVRDLDKRIYLKSGSLFYVKLTSNIMYVRAPGFFIALKHILKEHGKPLPHFDHVVTLTSEAGGRTKPHGLLGQTANFKDPVRSTGHQGEGVIEGTIADYEVSTLWSRNFKFDRYDV